MQTGSTSSVPHMSWGGTRDNSKRKILRASPALPFFRPLFLTYAKRGRTDVTYLKTSELVKEYGPEFAQVGSKYASLATPFMADGMEAQLRMLVLRIRPEDAGPNASLGLSLEIRKSRIPVYERTDEGYYKVDPATNEYIPTGEFIEDGIEGRWLLDVIGEDKDGGTLYGRRKKSAGTLGDDGDSQVYPVADIMLEDFGSDGNNFGIRMWAPSLSDLRSPLNTELMEDIKAYPYMLSIINRDNELADTYEVPTIRDESSVPFSFKAGAVSTQMGGRILDLADVVHDNWSEDNDNFETRSPLKSPEIYYDNIEEILGKIRTAELSYGTIPDDEDRLHEINFLSARTPDDVPYHAFMLHGPLEGGASLTMNASHFCKGGTDGTMTEEAYNRVAAQFGKTYTVNGRNLNRIARYPFNTFWDVGFSLETKIQLMNLLALPQLFVPFSTQDITRKPNDMVTDDAISLNLLTEAQRYPDSELFKTPPFRALISGSVGRWVGSRKRVLVPLSIDLFSKFAYYGRNDDGKLDGDFAFDEDEAKIITRVTEITNLDRKFQSKRRSWENGMVYAEDWDARRQFFAGVQSIYTDQTSVLNSAIVALTIVNSHWWAFTTWRSLTGNQKLTADQLVERSNISIESQSNYATDGRCVIVPHSELTEYDVLRGHSWSCPIDVYANGMRTVMNASVIAYRREDLANG